MLRDTTSRAGLRCFSVVVRGQVCTFADEHAALCCELGAVEAEIRSLDGESDYQYRLVLGLANVATDVARSEHATAYWRWTLAEQQLSELVPHAADLLRRIGALSRCRRTACR